MDERKELLPISSDSESSNGSVDCKTRIQNQSSSDLSQDVIKAAPTPPTDQNLFTNVLQSESLQNDEIAPNEPQISQNKGVTSCNDDDEQLSEAVKSEENDFLGKADSINNEPAALHGGFGEIDLSSKYGNSNLAISPNAIHDLNLNDGGYSSNIFKNSRPESPTIISHDSSLEMSEDLSTNLPKGYSSESHLANFSDTSVNSGSSIEVIETKSNSNTAKNSRPESPIITSNDSSLEKAKDLSPSFPKNDSSECPLVNYSDSSINSVSNIEVIETKSNYNTAKNSRPESFIITLNDSSLEKVEDLSTHLPKGYSSESPLVISSDSSIESIEIKSNSNSAIHINDSTLDMNEAADSGQKSAPASLPNCNFEIRGDNSINTLEISDPTSPASTVDSNSDTNDIETVSRAPTKNLSLPYFHLPNPDFDEFLKETERNLHIPDINTRASSIPRRTFEPKDKSDIVFLADSDASKSSSNTTEASSIPRRTFEPKDKSDIVFLADSDASKSSSKTTENTTCCSSDYQRLLSSIEKLDDSKSPGIKRLVLKNYLKKKIEEKKVINFERAKELAKVNDEEEIANEEAMFESESSGDDDIEEPTVSFDKEKMDSVDKNNFNTGSLELSNDVDHVSDDDSDDEGFGLPKARKVPLLEDESSDESYIDDGDSPDQNYVDYSPTDSKCEATAISSNCSDSPYLNFVDYSPTDSKYEVRATSSSCSDNYFQSSLTKELTNVEDATAISSNCSDSPDQNYVDYSPTDSKYEVRATSSSCNDNYFQSSLTKELTNVEDATAISSNCSDSPDQNYVDYSPTDSKYEVRATSSSCNDNYFQSSLTKELTNVEDDYDREMTGPGMEINSSFPSYQPGGGFNSKDDQDFDRKESHTPEKAEARDKYLMNKNSGSSRLNFHALEEDENEYKSLGLSLEDLPISQQEKESELFSTQDLETLCSGVFNGNVSPRNDAQSKSISYFELSKSSIHQKASSDKESNQFIHELDEGPQEKIQDFFDVEAELSGEDNDEAEYELDSDEGNEELGLVDDHEMLAEEELRDEIADLHMKKIRDEDAELLKDLKEKFLDDGELNDEGAGRTRKFAWMNNDTPAAISQVSDNSSSDSDEAVDENLSSMCKEKAKWRQEKAEEDLTGDIVSSYKKPHLKFNIIGKSGFSQNLMQSSKHNLSKRPRGSYLSLDDSEASLVLKKLKTSDDSHGGSRTTKHFVFRNEATIEAVPSKKSSSEKIDEAGPSSSVFNAL